jgi:hypothetical protein
VLAALVASVTIAAATMVVDRSGLEVRIAATPAGRVLWRQAVPAGQTVELRYRHSVELTSVTEVFRAEPDGLWFVEMRFASQGAGLPTEGYVREGDGFVLRRERRVGRLPLRVSSGSGHRLRVGDRELDLVALAGDGAAVSVTAGPARRWWGRGPR